MELPKNFGTWMCVTDTENFKRGELYASIGNNNGVQVAYFDEYGETRVVPFWLRIKTLGTTKQKVSNFVNPIFVETVRLIG